MNRLLARLVRTERGATMIEYMVLALAVVAGTVEVVTHLR
jgi:Flp pilus assembly pilin Flp